jgi:hypothetical protein
MSLDEEHAMSRSMTMGGMATLLVLALSAAGLWAEEPPVDEGGATAPAKKGSPTPKKPEEKKFRDFHELTQGAQKIDGLLTLHHKDEHLYAEIKPNQFDQPMLAPIAIARGMAMAGSPLNFGDEWVLSFHRVGDKVQLIRRNVHFKAPGGTPLDKAVKQNYTDSVLMALPILSINQAGGNSSMVIDLADIFLTDFAELGWFGGGLDRNRTTWHKIKGFPQNIELEVEATYGGRGDFGFFFDDSVIDRRGRTVVIHYSLAKLPGPGYKPRYADDRVGHFLSEVKDFGSPDPDTVYLRQINRWRLEKSDPKAKLSPPKKQIVWWIEDTVPHEYRPAVESGILEWNKAFEKIGFRNALAVRWQDGRDDFDPEDINYCTFRWVTTSGTFAMSGLRSDPITGEMIDGDVIFDASWVKYWKQEYALLTGSGAPPSGPTGSTAAALQPLAVGEVLSPIMALKSGYGLPFPLPTHRQRARLAAGAGVEIPDAVPAGWGSLQIQFYRRQAAGRFNACQYSSGMRPEMGLAAIALAGAATADDDPKGDDKDKDKQKDKKEEGVAKLPEEFLSQMIKEVVMHEVGHSLGLRHNFKASTMLSADQLNDTSITRAKGMTGSVMDYNPINIAPPGQKQGDFTTTTIGPYDYWAIEYAYTPIEGDEAAGLKKIAARSPEAGLAYATDEDMWLDNDPLVNAYDLGSDTLRFAKDRIALATQLLKDVDAKVVREGEAWARLRRAFSILLNQWGNGAYLAAETIGGQYVSRDHKGSKDARDPIVPVNGNKQREALRLVADQVLSDKAFQFSPALLRRLAGERWLPTWGYESYFFFNNSVDFPLYERILGIQKIVLGQCLAPDVLARLQNQELQAEAGSQPLKMSEVFRLLSDSIWSEMADGAASKDQEFQLSTIRRGLQREYLRRLCTMVLGRRRSPYEDMYGYLFFFGAPEPPADARSLARMHLKEISAKIDKVLGAKDASIDDTTRAHLEECRQRIAKVLEAAIQVNEP